MNGLCPPSVPRTVHIWSSAYSVCDPSFVVHLCRVSSTALPRATLPFPKCVCQHSHQSARLSCLLLLTIEAVCCGQHRNFSSPRTSDLCFMRAMRCRISQVQHALFGANSILWYAYHRRQERQRNEAQVSCVDRQGFRRDIIQTLNRDQQQAPFFVGSILPPHL